MKSYLKRLNWSGFVFMLIITGFGAVSRKQDTSIYESFMVWLIFGVPMSLMFLFTGIEPK